MRKREKYWLKVFLLLGFRIFEIVFCSGLCVFFLWGEGLERFIVEVGVFRFICC